MAPKTKTPGGRQRASGAPAKKKARTATKGKAQADTCRATTVKGTQCSLKAREGSAYCARHQKTESEPAPQAAAPAVGAAKNGKGAPRKKRSPAKAPPPQQTVTTPTPQQEPARPNREEEAEPADAAKEDDGPQETDEDDTFYGSEFSTTMEASPYDDLVTPEMAEGAEDVELRDEREFGRDQQRQPPPRLNREQAEEKARERLGERPSIAPEEDLDGTLAQYDQRLENEVRRLMGIQPRGRPRRGGGRRRGRGGGGGQQGGRPPGGGGHRDGGGRRRRGRRGGRSRRGGPPRDGAGDGAGSRRSGPTSSAARKVGRDSPLAQRRSSKGPKRGVQPRRRREPDV